MPGETNVGSLIVYLKANMKQFADSMQRAQMTVRNFGTRVQAFLSGVGAKLVRYFKYALPAAIALGVREAVKFEKQLAMVNTMLSRQTAHFLPKYEAGLKRLAVRYGENTATLSKGLYDILSASIPAAEAMDVLEKSVKAATAGFTTTAVSADAITTILNSYSLSADDAEKVSDILFATVKRGKTTFDQLASSIGVVTSVAATAGLKLEEVGAALATMTRAGLNTEIAVTALRQIILAFLDPQDEAIEAAKEFGLVLNSTTLQTEGLTGVMRRLSNATAEQISKIIPSARALTGFSAALRQSSEMAEDLKFMLDSAGQTQEAFDKATNTTDTTLRRFWEMIKGIARDVGDKFMEPMRTAADAILKINDNLQKELKETGKTIEDIYKAMDELQRRTPGLSPYQTPTLPIPAPPGPKTPAELEASEKGRVGPMSGWAVDRLDQMLKTPQVDYVQKISDYTKQAWQKAKTATTSAMAEIEQKTQPMLEKMAENYEKNMKKMEERAQKLKEKWDWLGQSLTWTIQSSFDQLIFEGQKFEDFMKNMLIGIARDIANIMVLRPIAQSISTAITQGMGAGAYHKGGWVGSGTPMKVPQLAYAAAPRLHSGLRTDEFPAVLQRGEQVIPKGGGPNVQVNVINQTGRNVTAQQGPTRIDGTNIVSEVIIRDAQTNGPITTALMSRFSGR